MSWRCPSPASGCWPWKYAALVLTGLAGTAISPHRWRAGSALFGHWVGDQFSGTRIGVGGTIWRILLATLYVAAGMAAVAAIGLFLSTVTEQTGSPWSSVVMGRRGRIVDPRRDPAGRLAAPLVVGRSLARLADLLRDPPQWGNDQDRLVDAAYALVFLLAAWARFAGNDVTS